MEEPSQSWNKEA